MASKKSKKPAPKAKKTTKPAVNKSEFIRSNADKSPGDIVKLAKSKGFDLSIAMVYTILSEYRKKQGKPATKVAKTTRVGKASGSTKNDESTFASLILKLGTERASQLFQSTLDKVKSPLGSASPMTPPRSPYQRSPTTYCTSSGVQLS